MTTTAPLPVLWWVVEVLAILVAVVSIVLMQSSNRQLKATSIGIVAFEKAWTSSRAADIMRVWGPTGRQAALVNLWADFPFVVGYSVALFSPCWALADTLGALTWPGAAGLSRLFAAGALVAGACDFAEDVCLLRILNLARYRAQPAIPEPLVRAASMAATIKFALVYVAVGWLVLFAVPSALAGLGLAAAA